VSQKAEECHSHYQAGQIGMIFRTSDIIEMIREIDPTIQCQVQGPGGDYDTSTVIATVNEEWISVKGFRVNQPIATRRGDPTDNLVVKMIELRSSESDSEGGISTVDERVAVFAARLKVALKKAGWDVVRIMDDYF
jgi:hypothetical protein